MERTRLGTTCVMIISRHVVTGPASSQSKARRTSGESGSCSGTGLKGRGKQSSAKAGDPKASDYRPSNGAVWSTNLLYNSRLEMARAVVKPQDKPLEVVGRLFRHGEGGRRVRRAFEEGNGRKRTGSGLARPALALDLLPPTTPHYGFSEE